MNQNDRRFRELEARQVLAIALARRHADLSDRAMQFLLDEATGTVEWQDHVGQGMPLAVRDILDAAERSEIGQLIFSARGQEQSNKPVDHAAAIAHMTPGQRLSYARAHGLA